MIVQPAPPIAERLPARRQDADFNLLANGSQRTQRASAEQNTAPMLTSTGETSPSRSCFDCTPLAFLRGEALQVGSSTPQRRGRPPKLSGQYSRAYSALKRYRERKREEMEAMEAEVLAKTAQLAALQLENEQKCSHEQALRVALGVQTDLMGVLAETQSGASTCSGGSSSTVASRAASTSAEEAVALVAAITGDDAPPERPLQKSKAGQIRPEMSAIAADMVVAAVRQTPSSRSVQAAAATPVEGAAVPPVEEKRSPEAVKEEYCTYVAAAAVALGRLSARLASVQPGSLPQLQGGVRPSAMGDLTAGDAEALGIAIPLMPVTLQDYATLADSYAGVPGILSLNMLSGEFEPSEPEVWRAVAKHLRMRPGQRSDLAAAYALYQSGLEGVRSERAGLLERLRTLLEGTTRVAGTAPGTASATALLGDAQLLDQALSQDEYYELSDAIKANLVREDSLTRIFDTAICRLFDHMQVAQMAVISWPHLPTMASIVHNLLN